MDVGRFFRIASLAAFLMLAGCGGGGGGTSGGGDMAPPTSNAPPVASFVHTPDGTAPSFVKFDASSSSDSDGRIVSYVWDPGDGTLPLSTVQVQHVYATAGAYVMTLTVTDDRGAVARATQPITVLPRPASPIVVTLVTPGEGGVAEDAVHIEVQVASTFEVGSVVATAAGRAVTLAYAGPEGPTRWIGELSLAGLPYGLQTFSVRAVDSRGNSDELVTWVLHDSAPAISVTAPVEHDVALTTLVVDASCTDDRPGCFVRLSIPRLPETRSATRLQATVDLRPLLVAGDRSTTVTLWGCAATGRCVNETRTVYIEDPARLSIAEQAGSDIVDLDAARFLTRRVFESRAEAWAFERRDTHEVEPIDLSSARWNVDPAHAFLVPGGAVLQLVLSPFSFMSWIYHLSGGALSELGSAGDSLKVAGAYATWTDDVGVRVLDVLGDRVRRVANVGTYRVDLAPDGTVTFADDSGRIWFDRDGVQSVAATETGYRLESPLTDGSLVAYWRSPLGSSTPGDFVLRDGTSSEILLANSTYPVNAQLVQGWTAYQTADGGPIYTRSPTGTIVKRTDLAARCWLERLAPSGEFTCLTGTQRWFGGSTLLVPVSSPAGEAFYLDGRWYLALGRALLAIRTDG